MSSRLRSLDSKISFFAFADIITAVSGVLIFVALLLATDLGRPTATQSQSTSSVTEQQRQDTLARQLEVDAQNQRLEELLATAETSPDPGKLQADITTLRTQLAREQQKQAVLDGQISASQAALAARDRALGLTDLNTTVTRLLQQVASIGHEDATTRENMERLQGQVDHAASQLLKLHQRENQIWLIPERGLTAKEPVLVTVTETTAIIDRFDRPDLRKQLAGSRMNTDFTAYLHHLKTNEQYVVFLIKPSGIQTFKDFVQSARDLGFEVGYDALEEYRTVHFGTPPTLDETVPGSDESTGTPGTGKLTANGSSVRPSSGPGGGSRTGPGGYGGTHTGAGGQGGSVTGPGGYGGSTPGTGGTGGSATGTGGTGNSTTGAGENGGTGSGDHSGSATNAVGKNGTSGSGQNGTAGNAGSTNNPHSSTTSSSGSTAPPAKSWWQRLLEWLGFK